MKKLRKPKSAITLLNEVLGIENAPSLNNSSTFEEIKEAAAEALGLNPEDMTIGLVPAKKSLEDFIDLKKTGDLWISFKTSVEDTDSVARQLNGFNFLDQIVINGETGRDLAAIVSDGTVLAGNIVITSKSTEAQIRLFLPHLGGEVSEQAFERYWSGIGGRCIGQQTIERIREQMQQFTGPRGMRGMLGGRRGRQSRYLREGKLNELGNTPGGQYVMGRVEGRKRRSGDDEGADEVRRHALRNLPRRCDPGDETDDLYLANHLGYRDELRPGADDFLDTSDSISGIRRREVTKKIRDSHGRRLRYYKDSVPEEEQPLDEIGNTERGMEQAGRLSNRQLWQDREEDSFKTQDQVFKNNKETISRDRKLRDAYWRGHGDESMYPKEFLDMLANIGGVDYYDNSGDVEGGASVDFTKFAETRKFKDISLEIVAEGYEEDIKLGDIIDFVDDIGYDYRDLLKKGSPDLEGDLIKRIKGWLESSFHSWYERASEEYWDHVDGQRAEYDEKVREDNLFGENMLKEQEESEDWRNDPEFIKTVAELDGTEKRHTWCLYWNGDPEDEVSWDIWITFNSKGFDQSLDPDDLYFSYDGDRDGTVDGDDYGGDELVRDLYACWKQRPEKEYLRKAVAGWFDYVNNEARRQEDEYQERTGEAYW